MAHTRSATLSETKRVNLTIRSSCPRPRPRPCQRPDISMSVDTAPRQSPNILSTDTSDLSSSDNMGPDKPLENTTKKIPQARPSCTKTKSYCEFNSHKCSNSSPSYRVGKKYRNQSQLSSGLCDNSRSPSNSKDAVPRGISAYDPPTLDSRQQYSLERFHLDDGGVSCIVDLGSGRLNISKPHYHLALATIENLDSFFP